MFFEKNVSPSESDFFLYFTCLAVFLTAIWYSLTEWLCEKSSFSCLGSLKDSWYFDDLHLNSLKGFLMMFESSLQK